MQRFTTSVSWTCPECNHDNHQDVEVPELDFTAEKSSDMAVDGMAELVCSNCETEYTGWVYVSPGDTTFEMEEPHRFSASGDIPMYEPTDEDYDPPTDPYSIALEALESLDAMVGSASPTSDDQFTNRLIFAGSISLLEAYLGDTLINGVQSELSARNNLVRNNDKLSDLKIPAIQIVGDSEVLTKLIVKELRDVLYHNLSVAKKLYVDAFSIDIMPSKAESDCLYPAVLKRHDCVHRNGRNKDGEKLTDFTDNYVREVLAAIGRVVRHVEQERTKDCPF